MIEEDILSEEKKIAKRRKAIRNISISVIAWMIISLAFTIPFGMAIEAYGGGQLNFGGYFGLFIMFSICLFPIDYYIDKQFKD